MRVSLFSTVSAPRCSNKRTYRLYFRPRPNRSTRVYSQIPNRSDCTILFYEQDLPATSRSTLRERFGVQPDETALLFFGLIRPYKGLDVLLRALHGIDLHKSKIRLFIAGEFYTKRDPYDELLEASGSERITLIDRFVRDDEAAELMTLCDAMVLPYRSASQSGIFYRMRSILAYRSLPVIFPGFQTRLYTVRPDYWLRREMWIPCVMLLWLSSSLTCWKGCRTNTLELKKQYSWTRFCTAPAGSP